MPNDLASLFGIDTPGLNKDQRQRLRYYIEWLQATNRNWYDPDLDAYRDYLLKTRHLKPSSVAVHIGAVKTAYHTLWINPKTPQLLKQEFLNDDGMEQVDPPWTVSIYTNGWGVWHLPGRVHVDRNIQVRHLTTSQINELFSQIKVDTPIGVRDATAIGLMLCAGISATELCTLTADDLERDEGENLQALHVPKTPGGTARMAPIYDKVIFDAPCLGASVEKLQQLTGPRNGPLIRGFHPRGCVPRETALKPQAIQKMLRGYTVTDEEVGEINITALDLRRTYARWLYRSGVAIATLQANLGHRLLKTSWEYIGLPDPFRINRNDEPADGRKLLERLGIHTLDANDKRKET